MGNIITAKTKKNDIKLSRKKYANNMKLLKSIAMINQLQKKRLNRN
jgi:hypothetical protein